MTESVWSLVAKKIGLNQKGSEPASQMPKIPDPDRQIQLQKERQSRGVSIGTEDPVDRVLRRRENIKSLNTELFQAISTLLRDKKFLVSVASATHQSYLEYVQKTTGEVPDTLKSPMSDEEEQLLAQENKDPDLMKDPSYREAAEKYNANLVGVYALQEAVGLMTSADRSAESVIHDIALGTLADDEVLLLLNLSHFAWQKNQVWFKGEGKAAFKPAALLSLEDKQKAFLQVQTAARMLAQELQIEVPGSAQMPEFTSERVSPEDSAFLTQLTDVIRDREFLKEAAYMANHGYGQRELAKLSPQDRQDVESNPDHGMRYLLDELDKNNDAQVAMNTVGILALISGLNYIAESSKSIHPKKVLEQIVTGKVDPAIQDLLCRFAHLGWIEDQPHKSKPQKPDLEIKHRDINMYDNLAPEDQHKDWGQIQDAALVLAKKLGIET